MKTRRYLVYSTSLSAAGVLFAGYLSAVRLLSNSCAFDEPCPLFLGQPACYTGFGLFSALLAMSVGGFFAGREARWPVAANALLSALGVLFAGRMTALEIAAHGGLPRYGLGLPTCSYGLLVFLALFALSAAASLRHPRELTA